MASSPVRELSDEYTDILRDLPYEMHETEDASLDDYHLSVILRRSERVENWRTAIPVAVPSARTAASVGAADSLRDRASLSVVLDDISRAPFAYFRFISVVGFLMFLGSLLLYSLFHVLLFNPILAVLGAIGSLLTASLVQLSLAVEKRRSR